MKLLSTVYAYIVLNGTSKSGRYIEVAAIPGWPLSGAPLYIGSFYKYKDPSFSMIQVNFLSFDEVSDNKMLGGEMSMQRKLRELCVFFDFILERSPQKSRP